MHVDAKLLLSLALIAAAVGLLGYLVVRDQNTNELYPPLLEAFVVEAVPENPLPTYIEITEGCTAEYEGGCVNVRMSATSTAPSLMRLRTGIVLPVASTTVTDETGRAWYKVHFTEWIRYPDRVPKDWFVAEDLVRSFGDPGAKELSENHSATNKRIVVDRSEQMLYAYEGEDLYLETQISTGRDLTPTPRGTFTVFRKMPSRYMQGPLPGISDQYYDLPGVPWSLYFTKEGGAIHGAYWHTEFGSQWSHGCVNVPLDTARTLYEWTPLGTTVVVRD